MNERKNKFLKNKNKRRANQIQKLTTKPSVSDDKDEYDSFTEGLKVYNQMWDEHYYNIQKLLEKAKIKINNSYFTTQSFLDDVVVTAQTGDRVPQHPAVTGRPSEADQVDTTSGNNAAHTQPASGTEAGEA